MRELHKFRIGPHQLLSLRQLDPGLNYTRPNSSSDCHPPCLAYQYGNKKKKKKKKKVTQEHAITVRLDARTAQISDWTPPTA